MTMYKMAKKKRSFLQAIWYFAYLFLVGPFFFLFFITLSIKGYLPDFIGGILALAVAGYWMYLMSDISDKERIRNNTTYVKIRHW